MIRSLFIPNFTVFSLVSLISIFPLSFWPLSGFSSVFLFSDLFSFFKLLSILLLIPKLIEILCFSSSLLIPNLIFWFDKGWIWIYGFPLTPNITLLLLIFSSIFISLESSSFTPNLIFWFDNGWIWIFEISFTPNLTFRLSFSSFWPLIFFSSFITPNLIFWLDKGWIWIDGFSLTPNLTLLLLSSFFSFFEASSFTFLKLILILLLFSSFFSFWFDIIWFSFCKCTSAFSFFSSSFFISNPNLTIPFGNSLYGVDISSVFPNFIVIWFALLISIFSLDNFGFSLDCSFEMLLFSSFLFSWVSLMTPNLILSLDNGW